MPSRDKDADSVSMALARHVCSLSAGRFAASTREAAARCVLDVLAAAGAGFAESSVRAGRRAAVALFGAGPSDVWFTGASASACACAFSNSLAASALDLDDGNRHARGHPGAAVIPAAWAVLAARPDALMSADRFIEAVVAGYEMGVRIAVGRVTYAPSGAWSPYAAIAAAGKLEGASPEVLAHAFGIAAQTAPALPGLAGLMGSDVKEAIPFGCAGGITALRLAQEGFTGPLQVFDDDALFSGARIRRELGAAPLIERTYFKPFACCRHAHAPLEAYIALEAGHGFDASRIAAIEVHTYRATFNLANVAAPATLVEAQYSVPYCVALCAVLGRDALLPIHEAHLREPAVLSLARRVSMKHDPDLDACFPERSPARVVVRLESGDRLSSPTTEPKGDPHLPLTWEELRGKFRMATAGTMTPDAQAQVLDAVEKFRGGDL